MAFQSLKNKYYINVVLSQLKLAQFWLLGIATGLIAIHLTTTWKREYTDLLGMSFLLWASVCFLVWKKRHNLSFRTGIIASTLGIAIVVLVLAESIFNINRFPYISPALSAIGLALLASGFRGLKQYWQEILILAFPALAHGILLFVFDVSELTAKFAAFQLWYGGFNVIRNGVNIILPTGVVEVNQGCSGLANILHLWLLSVLFLVMFPLKGYKKILVPVVATCIGFIINSFRVALMAILVASSQQKVFEYWHTGDGSLIFSTVSVLIFGLFCLFLLRIDEPKQQNAFVKGCATPPSPG